MTEDSHPNDIGKPISGVVCYVLNDELRQVAPGEQGELYIGGVQLSDGYINNDELNKQRFISNPFV